MRIIELQEQAELCSAYAVNLFRVGFVARGFEWLAIAERAWQQWIAAMEAA